MNLNEAKTAIGYPQAPQEDPLAALMREYVQAKHEFDAACQTHLNAAQNNAMAEQRLAGLSEKVAATVQQGLYDPTVPQPSTEPLNAMQMPPGIGTYSWRSL